MKLGIRKVCRVMVYLDMKLNMYGNSDLVKVHVIIINTKMT